MVPAMETPEQRRRRIFIRNIILSVMSVGLALYALKTNHEQVAAGALAFFVGLWMHSGRRPPPSALASSNLPVGPVAQPTP